MVESEWEEYTYLQDYMSFEQEGHGERYKGRVFCLLVCLLLIMADY